MRRQDQRSFDDTIRDAIFDMSLELQACYNDFEYRNKLYRAIEQAEKIAKGLVQTLSDPSVGHVEARRQAKEACNLILEALRYDRVEQPVDLAVKMAKEQKK